MQAQWFGSKFVASGTLVTVRSTLAAAARRTAHPRRRASAHGAADVLTPEVVAFLTELEHEFGGRRRELLARRGRAAGERCAWASCRTSCPRRASIREGDWRVAPYPEEIADRRVEITGPVDRKMVINALNSGAKVFMADFEDANSPTWENCIEGQRNLTDALDRTIELDAGEKRYRLNDEVGDAVRPPARLAPGRAALRGRRRADVGVALRLRPLLPPQPRARRATTSTCRSSSRTSRRGSGTTSSASRRTRLGVPRGTIKATVLIETILAAFEMDEILYELREHSAGLNAGRWDYIFSVIKKLGHRPEFVLPDRGEVTMAVPFMRAYCELLVKTCHRRGAFAMGGMAAFIPSRRDPEVNAIALEKVREDKEREASQGFDGTWVAHPDLVPVALEAFDAVLGERPNQIDRQRDDVAVGAADAARRRLDARRDHRAGPAQQRLGRHPVPRRLAAGLGRGRDRQPHGGRGDGRDLAARRSGNGCATTASRTTRCAARSTRRRRPRPGLRGRARAVRAVATEPRLRRVPDAAGVRAAPRLTPVRRDSARSCTSRTPACARKCTNWHVCA